MTTVARFSTSPSSSTLCSASNVLFAPSSKIFDEYPPKGPAATPAATGEGHLGTSPASNSFSFVSMPQPSSSPSSAQEFSPIPSQHDSFGQKLKLLDGEDVLEEHRAGASSKICGDWSPAEGGVLLLTNFRLIFVPFFLFTIISDLSHEQESISSSSAKEESKEEGSSSLSEKGSLEINEHVCSFQIDLRNIEEGIRGIHRPQFICENPACMITFDLSSRSLHSPVQGSLISLHPTTVDFPPVGTGSSAIMSSSPLASFLVDQEQIRVIKKPQKLEDNTKEGMKESKLWKIAQGEESSEKNESGSRIFSVPIGTVHHYQVLYQHSSEFMASSNPGNSTLEGVWPSQFPEGWKGGCVGLVEVNCKSFRSFLFVCLSSELPHTSPLSSSPSSPFSAASNSPSSSNRSSENLHNDGMVFEFEPPRAQGAASMFTIGNLCPWYWTEEQTNSQQPQSSNHPQPGGRNGTGAGDPFGTLHAKKGPSSNGVSSNGIGTSEEEREFSGEQSSPTQREAETFDRMIQELRKRAFFTDSLKSLKSHHLENIFAFSFSGHSLDGGKHSRVYDIEREFKRIGFSSKLWKVSNINSDYKVSPTYPSQVIVPRCATDDVLKGTADFRTKARFPVVCWISKETGAVLVRCSQPRTGFLRSRNVKDERMFHIIAASARASNRHSTPKNGDTSGMPVAIFDCRARLNAFANQAHGGGTEALENYPGCRLEYLGIPNIHSMRDSLSRVHDLCQTAPGSKWFSSLEYTSWKDHIMHVLSGADQVVSCISDSKNPTSVVVHCSDGWDRTSQLVSLAEILLDPYYRTLEGFQVIIEREWISFGHKFNDRLGMGKSEFWSQQECSPIFVQWIECVWQILSRCRCAFEFTPKLLIFLLDALFSNLFGNFLMNCNRERDELGVRERSKSIWSYIDQEKHRFINPFFVPQKGVLRNPIVHPMNLHFWEDYYARHYSYHSQALSEQGKWDDQFAEVADKHLRLREEIDQLKETKETLEKELEKMKEGERRREEEREGEEGECRASTPSLAGILIVDDYNPG
mmetsp:Transcript_17534/g.24388  ORF Transcript_17534/g.24388 Transcript_17534/m.24388 type:complete len:1035 (+) Transcript_17534:215-3319(+)|eukprot:CAMPEP_0201490278 /NCGR_PEP_ID=MMETSP0151_2-20130828/25892_1 /ASSEMBLY_ACC=CAM_ASM_000257 /TAXON_ID=200890 /ORGANISM="Paramoeba atlantica, Strain 621/1 / CCAP 1560/9" /LENGTH=1034 /DNA_ID=CAMNT_0047876179 /DNA_START=214 /DNA_END=3321 /DNA_ORIENTATION=-